MRQGVLVYDERSERMDIRFGEILWRPPLRHHDGRVCK